MIYVPLEFGLRVYDVREGRDVASLNFHEVMETTGPLLPMGTEEVDFRCDPRGEFIFLPSVSGLYSFGVEDGRLKRVADEVPGRMSWSPDVGVLFLLEATEETARQLRAIPGLAGTTVLLDDERFFVEGDRIALADGRELDGFRPLSIRAIGRRNLLVLYYRPEESYPRHSIDASGKSVSLPPRIDNLEEWALVWMEVEPREHARVLQARLVDSTSGGPFVATAQYGIAAFYRWGESGTSVRLIVCGAGEGRRENPCDVRTASSYSDQIINGKAIGFLSSDERVLTYLRQGDTACLAIVDRRASTSPCLLQRPYAGANRWRIEYGLDGSFLVSPDSRLIAWFDVWHENPEIEWGEPHDLYVLPLE